MTDTNVLNFIKMQREKGLDDYAILQATKNMMRNSKNNMKGGFILSNEQREFILQKLSCIDRNTPGYNKFESSVKGDGFFMDYNNFEDIINELDNMSSFSTKKPTRTCVTGGDEPETQEETTKEEKPETEEETTKEENPQTEEETTEQKEEKKEESSYTTLQEGEILYYPSQDVKGFSQSSMIFVDLPKALDLSQQRSFVIFFTKSKEYAQRFSGLWSLNKRPVFVHKLKVIKPITNIKIIDRKIIPDNLENTELAKGMCGSSIDGYINGIMISYDTKNDNTVDEYYICNPDTFFKIEESWMQFDSTEWIKISGDTEKIDVPQEKEKVESSDETGNPEESGASRCNL
jgi:hypothetical protein